MRNSKSGVLEMTFDKEVRELAHAAFGGRCWICLEPGVEYHHRLANTVTNNRLYPNLLHSIFNCAFLCRDCHVQRKHELNFTPGMARAYEYTLKEAYERA